MVRFRSGTPLQAPANANDDIHAVQQRLQIGIARRPMSTPAPLIDDQQQLSSGNIHPNQLTEAFFFAADRKNNLSDPWQIYMGKHRAVEPTDDIAHQISIYRLHQPNPSSPCRMPNCRNPKPWKDPSPSTADDRRPFGPGGLNQQSSRPRTIMPNNRGSSFNGPCSRALTLQMSVLDPDSYSFRCFGPKSRSNSSPSSSHLQSANDRDRTSSKRCPPPPKPPSARISSSIPIAQ
ncbi:hypothetical protein ACLOJK_027104 [Asimina triloba]